MYPLTYLPVEFLFIFHPHIFCKWIIIFMRVTIHDHIFTDNAWTSTPTTWIFHGCAFELKPERKGPQELRVLVEIGNNICLDVRPP